MDIEWHSPPPMHAVEIYATRDEARVLVMALNDAARSYPDAVGRDHWREWAAAIAEAADV